MSQPISTCEIYKAALGDEKAYKYLLKAMDYNSTQICYTRFPCRCNPPCHIPTQEQFDKLNSRMKQDLDNLKKERLKKVKPHGNFDKWIFPVIKNMKMRKLTKKEKKELGWK